MNTGDRIREVRASTGLTLEEFGKRVGVTKVAIHNLEHGNRALTDQMCKLICKEFHISEDWLRDGTGSMAAPREADLVSRVAREYDLDEFGENFVRKFLELDEDKRKIIKEYMTSVVSSPEKRAEILPKPPRRTVPKIYLGKNAAAGTFVESFESLFHGTIEVVEDQLSERADYCIGVSGDSMSPLYEDGDILLVERPDNHLIEYGEIGIFQYMNTLYVKKLGRDCLESINPDYKPLPNNGDVRCLGRVIGVAERP